MSSTLRVCVVPGVLFALSLGLGGLGGPGEARAGTVAGRLELPPAPERAPSATRGFLERVENPLAPPRRPAFGPSMIVVLEQVEGGAPPTAPGQVTYLLVGESFARPVIGVPVGAEVVIKNVSRTARALVAAEDPKLIPADPINPTGSKSFRATEPKVYTLADKDAAHLTGTIVVVKSGYVANVDEAGRFQIEDVPEGNFKLRIFYRDAWLEGATDVTVGAKGKTEVNPKVPALPAKK